MRCCDNTPLPRQARALSRFVAGLSALVLAAAPAPANSQSSPSPPAIPSGCQIERAATAPAVVDLAQVFRDVYALEDSRQGRLFNGPNRGLDQALAALFDPAAPKSKLEQFYTLLYQIARHASHPGDEIAFDVAGARALLLSSKVFSDPEFPRQIVRIQLARTDRGQPRYQVTFGRPEVWLPLNQGRGFGVVREGMCQHAKALVFYGAFSFALAMPRQNVVVSDFENVDLWGAFGTRGLVDIDVNYVSVKSVEFLGGSDLGLVRAKVSRREFEVNRHFFLLEWITKFVTDKSVQPIDW
jgi:hypothetical protein